MASWTGTARGARLPRARLQGRGDRGAPAAASDTIKVIDAIGVYKHADGELEVKHSATSPPTRRRSSEPRWERSWASASPARTARMAGAELGAEAAEDGIDVFEGEEWDVLGEIPPNTAAALLLIEHHWAVPLRDAVARAGGVRRRRRIHLPDGSRVDRPDGRRRGREASAARPAPSADGMRRSGRHELPGDVLPLPHLPATRDGLGVRARGHLPADDLGGGWKAFCGLGRDPAAVLRHAHVPRPAPVRCDRGGALAMDQASREFVARYSPPEGPPSSRPLADLHDRGKLTDEEFAAEKARVLGAERLGARPRRAAARRPRPRRARWASRFYLGLAGITIAAITLAILFFFLFQLGLGSHRPDRRVHLLRRGRDGARLAARPQGRTGARQLRLAAPGCTGTCGAPSLSPTRLSRRKPSGCLAAASVERRELALSFEESTATGAEVLVGGTSFLPHACSRTSSARSRPCTSTSSASARGRRGRVRRGADREGRGGRSRAARRRPPGLRSRGGVAAVLRTSRSRRASGLRRARDEAAVPSARSEAAAPCAGTWRRSGTSTTASCPSSTAASAGSAAPGSRTTSRTAASTTCSSASPGPVVNAAPARLPRRLPLARGQVPGRELETLFPSLEAGAAMARGRPAQRAGALPARSPMRSPACSRTLRETLDVVNPYVTDRGMIRTDGARGPRGVRVRLFVPRTRTTGPARPRSTSTTGRCWTPAFASSSTRRCSMRRRSCATARSCSPGRATSRPGA